MVGKLWRIAAVVAMVATLGVATVGVVVYAQEAATGTGAVWDFGQKVKEAIAGALGISVLKYEETVTAAEKQVLADAVAAGQITQEQADRMQQRLDNGGGFGFPGMGPGRDEMKGMLLTVAAEKLGMTEAELRTELQSGKSIADVAKEKDVDTQVISDAYLAKVKAALDGQVAAGTLTQTQADARLAAETEALPDRLTGTWQEMGGPGRGRHSGGPDNAPLPAGEGGL